MKTVSLERRQPPTLTLLGRRVRLGTAEVGKHLQKETRRLLSSFVVSGGAASDQLYYRTSWTRQFIEMCQRT
ncbi:hypothetical protein T07_13885 [Trichinella nelsoni]|uniref:Uncharacterized protein n=1 Tax=Trichinella nelsoni TaxID=6336 RepID=A0A0V0S5I1_9BILA|nr:hypothetical protein T07_13885 [Trichinella nelsoni]